MHLRRCLSAQGFAASLAEANALVDALVEASMPDRPASAPLAIVEQLLRMQGVDCSRQDFPSGRRNPLVNQSVPSLAVDCFPK